MTDLIGFCALSPLGDDPTIGPVEIKTHDGKFWPFTAMAEISAPVWLITAHGNTEEEARALLDEQLARFEKHQGLQVSVGTIPAKPRHP